MMKQFAILLSLAFLAATVPAPAAPEVVKPKDGKETITAPDKAKDKVAPSTKDQKGGKKGGDKTNAPVKSK